MKRFRYYYDIETNRIHIEKHNITPEEIEIFFNEIPIWVRERKDKSLDSIGKLPTGRYIRVIYRKLSDFDYFIITAFDIEYSYEKEFIDKELEKL
jgi:hypothetical protein